MKTILVALLLVSTSVFAQGYYPNQQPQQDFYEQHRRS